MFQVENYTGRREENYDLLLKQLEALISDEPNLVANLANASSLLNGFLENVNWVGFYLTDAEDMLVLGPFQGLPACVRIPFGRGVCGTAASTRETQLVADVHAFPGHIACDAATQSEIVVPIVVDGKVIGVLDIDSPTKNRFDELDKVHLEKFVSVLLKDI